KGLASGVGQGQATITAAYGGQQGSTTLAVTAAVLARVDVTPTNPSIAKGTTQQLAATAVFTDTTNQDVTLHATWPSPAPAAATAPRSSAPHGLATGVAQGHATITAAYGGQQGSTTLTVTAAVITRVDVTPTDPSIAKGTQQQLTATAVFSDST